MKYYGVIGYAITEETSQDIWEAKIIERPYSGDVLKYGSKRTIGDNINSDINITNRISIIADPFAFQNFSNICYVSWMGTLWNVTSVDVDYPRLVLDVGGVYNGEQA